MPALAGLEPLGVAATDDIDLACSSDVDAVVYTVNSDFRPVESQAEVEAVLRAGTNVVTPSFYPLYHPPSTPPALAEPIRAACLDGGSSILASGIDPGWICDILPLFLTGMSADITEIRSREIFNYALYDQPDAVRTLIGFGGPMEATPPMLLDFALEMVWGPVVRVVADGLGVAIDEIRTVVEKRALERTVTVAGMGDFEKGGMGAFRFEVQGIVDGRPLIVMEHITRIDDDCALNGPCRTPARACTPSPSPAVPISPSRSMAPNTVNPAPPAAAMPLPPTASSTPSPRCAPPSRASCIRSTSHVWSPVARCAEAENDEIPATRPGFALSSL